MNEDQSNFREPGPSGNNPSTGQYSNVQYPNGYPYQSGPYVDYGQGQNGYETYYYRPAVSGSIGTGASVTGLIFGIIAVLFAGIPIVNTLGLILGVIGIICAASGRKQAWIVGAPTGLGTAGLVISIIGTVLSGIGFLSCTVCAFVIGSFYPETEFDETPFRAIRCILNSL